MNPTIESPFTDKFPGPYCYLSGVDGVDETFDIHCVTSGQHIASTCFWDEQTRCEVIAATVTAALNHAAGRPKYDAWKLKPLLPLFKPMFSGPFHTRTDCCPGRGPFSDVYCTANEESVLQAFESSVPGEAEQIAKHVADALNAFLANGDG